MIKRVAIRENIDQRTSKSLSNEERFKLENLKLKIENERLKKGYMVEGAGASKEFVILKDVNSKS